MNQVFRPGHPLQSRLQLPNIVVGIRKYSYSHVRISTGRPIHEENGVTLKSDDLIDASDENRWQRVRQVNAVLKELEADRVPQIRVYNKIDRLDRKPRVTNNRDGAGRARPRSLPRW